MYTLDKAQLERDRQANVTAALVEDLGSGDITAQLVPWQSRAQAHITAKQNAVVCGSAWVEAVFERLDPGVSLDWQVSDGDRVVPGQVLCQLTGPARALLSGERSALNFLQTLSATATRSRRYADMVKHTAVKLLDTRKTLPGLRLAQKYAVTCGGCHNHRIGLYDAFLIKENHIAACGSIVPAVDAARRIAPGKPVEVEVENFGELQQALKARADMILLDNFGIDALYTAVRIADGRARLEASGGVTHAGLPRIAETGVDYISIGTLTKDLEAVDLSMRLSL
ncbi:nicotinate-nucleotide pyrophosphorylase [carboxylating] [Modicisalibacter muralis]|uniref:Probable nicotinate-nucleotide pyrophosphorylase [carboxylating] n=1 Tax=Modicisalibacter muralis TaxID=119000 RepID=A0A1G9JSH1_9GAMM|nr:carboxylating nicotinate-nucleotide diphosphorylase [Halomonas muralis]SDL40216.1 nicotinate-nucleotide pyrophosphorylase [carboxylating] [Halomonas muralis]